MPKKHKIKPKPNLTIVKKICVKNENVNWKREINEDLTENKLVEERKILTEFLNAPVEEIDDTLGIAEIECFHRELGNKRDKFNIRLKIDISLVY